jgi:hypothetical protein
MIWLCGLAVGSTWNQDSENPPITRALFLALAAYLFGRLLFNINTRDQIDVLRELVRHRGNVRTYLAGQLAPPYRVLPFALSAYLLAAVAGGYPNGMWVVAAGLCAAVLANQALALRWNRGNRHAVARACHVVLFWGPLLAAVILIGNEGAVAAWEPPLVAGMLVFSSINPIVGVGRDRLLEVCGYTEWTDAMALLQISWFCVLAVIAGYLNWRYLVRLRDSLPEDLRAMSTGLGAKTWTQVAEKSDMARG